MEEPNKNMKSGGFFFVLLIFFSIAFSTAVYPAIVPQVNYSYWNLTNDVNLYPNDIEWQVNVSNLTVRDLQNCDSVDTDEFGKLICGIDASGSGSYNYNESLWLLTNWGMYWLNDTLMIENMYGEWLLNQSTDTIAWVLSQSYLTSYTETDPIFVSENWTIPRRGKDELINGTWNFSTTSDSLYVHILRGEVYNLKSNFTEIGFGGGFLINPGVSWYTASDMLPIGAGVINLGSQTQIYGNVYSEIFNASSIISGGTSHFKRVAADDYIEVYKTGKKYIIGKDSGVMIPYVAGGTEYVFNINSSLTTGIAYNYPTASIWFVRAGSPNIIFDLGGSTAGNINTTGKITAKDYFSGNGTKGWTGTITERDGSLCYVLDGLIVGCP